MRVGFFYPNTGNDLDRIVMWMMIATSRAKSSIAAAVALAFSAIIYRDLIILIAFLILVTFLMGELIWLGVVFRRPAKWLSLSTSNSADARQKQEPISISRSLYSGDTKHLDLFFIKNVNAAAVVSFDYPYLKINPADIKCTDRVIKLRLDFTTSFSGEYSINSLKVDLKGPLGLFNGQCLLPVSINYSVFPRVLDVAVTSSKILGRQEIGEVPTNRPGIGTEFYELRGYQAGDDFRWINWKASARHNELIINERTKEVGASYYLVLEAIAPDYFDKDRLASTFLQLANTLTILGTRLGIVVHDGEQILSLKKIDSSLNSLSFALNVALEFADLKTFGWEEKLTAIPSYTMRSNQGLLMRQEFGLLSEIEDIAILKKRKDLKSKKIYKTIIDLVRGDENESPEILYVTGFFSPIGPTIELATNISRIYRTEFTLINPTAPWVATANENDAYKVYERYSKNLGAIRNAGIDYLVGEPTTIVQKLFSV